MKHLLHNRPLLIIAAAESISSLGSWVTLMAVLSLVVFRGDGTVAQTSGILLAGLLPLLIFSPVAGWLADRFDRKWLMIGSELLSGLVVSGLFFVERLEFIYALLALQAACTAVMLPARQSAVPLLVARDELTRANALLQQLSSLVRIGGPLFAGLLLTVLDPHQAILLDALSFMVSGTILSRLPSLKGAISTTLQENGGVQSESSETLTLWTTLRTTPLLGLLYTVAFCAVLVIISFNLFSSIVTRDMLQSDQRLYGLLMGAIGLGTLLGALWLGLRKRGGDPWRDMFVGLLLMGMAPAAFAALAWVPNLSLAQLLVSTACLVAGVGNGLALVQSGTLLQTLAPQAVLGRAGGVLQSIMVVGQLTGLVLVPLAVPGLVSITLFFAGATLALWLIAAGGALLRRVWSKPPAMQAFTTEGAEGALPLDKLGNREVEGGAEVPTR